VSSEYGGHPIRRSNLHRTIIYGNEGRERQLGTRGARVGGSARVGPLSSVLNQVFLYLGIFIFFYLLKLRFIPKKSRNKTKKPEPVPWDFEFCAEIGICVSTKWGFCTELRYSVALKFKVLCRTHILVGLPALCPDVKSCLRCRLCRTCCCVRIFIL
jgi:hypothetical protein